MDLIADTTFLVGLWRGQDWARQYAVANTGKSIGLPWVVLGEFWHGAVRAGHGEARVRSFLAIGVPLTDADAVIPVYAQMCARLQDQACWSAIGENDLWIAATSLAHDRPLVTRNKRHFDVVEGLRLEVLVESGEP